MKSYEAMAADVLRRIHDNCVEKQRKRKERWRVAVPALCGLCAALIGFGAWQGNRLPGILPTQSDVPPAVNLPSADKTTAEAAADETTSATQATTAVTEGTTQTTQTQKTTAATVYVPSDDASGASPTPFIILYQEKAKADAGNAAQLMLADEDYAYNIYLNMVSTKGMSPSQKDALFNQCVAKANRFWIQHSGHYGGHSVHTTDDEYIIAVASLNSFRIKLDATKEFKQMRVYTDSPYGAVQVHGSKVEGGRLSVMPFGQDVTVSKEQAQRLGDERYQNDGILSFDWKPTDSSTKLMEGKTDLDYTAFNDTIHIELTYADGTKTTGSIRLVFDKTGEATVFCGDYALVKP